jgi:hypothetical protein
MDREQLIRAFWVAFDRADFDLSAGRPRQACSTELQAWA